MANHPVLVAYVPVLHAGYVQFFKKYTGEIIYLIDPTWSELQEALPELKKDIRALPVAIIQQLIADLKIFADVKILNDTTLQELRKNSLDIILPQDDISHFLAEKYFADKNLTWDSVFLRWDKSHSLQQEKVQSALTISQAEFVKQMMKMAEGQVKKSADWWRQVGAVLTKEDTILLVGYNQHVPSNNQPYFDGDPRGNFHKGDHIELSTALHAEASLIAEAARRGLSLEGSDIYVTTFPCPNCAKLIAYAGIRRLFFKDGYAMLDGESILKDHQVQIIQVQS